MKTKTIFIPVVIIVIITTIIFIFYPDDSVETKADDYIPYISAYTSGTISNQSSIRIAFTGESETAKAEGKVNRELFEFDPKIEGTAYWIDKGIIEFRPEHVLPPGKSYEAEFNLSKVMEVPEGLSQFSFNFQTIEQDYQPSYKGIRAYNWYDLELQMLHGQVQTADYAKPADVELMLEARQSGKELPVTWVHGREGKVHKYTLDSVVRKENPVDVRLEWDGEAIGAETDKEEVITVPALSDFEIIKINVKHQPEQYVSLSFSDPIDEKQDMEGLIRFKSGTPVDVSINGNEVKVFPKEPLETKKSLIVDPAVKNSLGYRLDTRWRSSVSFKNMKPKVEYPGDGNILPSSTGLRVPFRAVNLSGVHVRVIKIFEENIPQFFQENQFDGEDNLKRVGRIVYNDDFDLTSQKPMDLGKWNTFGLDLSEMISVEPGAIYRVQLNFRKDQSLYPCKDGEPAKEYAENKSWESKKAENESDVRYWHYKRYNYYNRDVDFNWRERDDPCKDSYYMRYQHAVSKNVLASDFGIIAKRGKTDRMLFAVTNLKNTKPVSNVTLDVYNFQQQLITQTKTNSKGMANIRYQESKPYFVIAKKGDEYGYLRVDDGSSLSLSTFNVAGRKTQHGLKGFIYGDRGVRRPGDSIYVSFMLYDEQNTLPEKHPVVFELINVKGQVVKRKVSSSGVNGLYAFRTKTNSEAPTGNWKARIKVGGAVFTKTIKVETIKPNRLKMNLDFGTDRFSYGNRNPEGELSVQWLHGAKAPNLKAEVRMKLAASDTRFKDFPGYTFKDDSREFSSSSNTIFDGKLDEEGQAQVSPELDPDSQPAGMLNAYFTIKAFEKSGNFSITQDVIQYSPYKSYVGVKVPSGDGWHGALLYDEEYTLPLVTVDGEGEPVSRNNLKVEIYKVKWRWWWERNEQDDLSRYVGSNSRHLMHEGSASTTTNGKGFYNFSIGEKYWGRIYIRVIDKKSGHSTGDMAYVSYPGWNQGETPGGATMLQFTTNEDSYEAGDEVSVKLPTSENGRALVSLENGSRVLKTFWVKTTKEFTRFNFTATENMSPNVYVHVSLIQPHNTTENDLPIRMYGVQPVKVENAESHLEPEIDMPSEIAPLETVEFGITESAGKSMNYTVAIVDEGLLDITGFSTPKPWNHFYARDALGVKTWDMYDYVIGAFSGEFAGLYEVGGGLDIQSKDANNANRFKPVVKYFGPFHLKSGQRNTHTFKMPQYIGSVKTMVVASHEDAFGSADTTTPVKKPLMVQSTLPRVIGPGEKIKLPVTVFAMEENIRNVRVTVETNDLLKPLGNETKRVQFDSPGDKIVNFTYKAREKQGVANVKVTAKSGPETSVSETELQVRAPNPRTIEIMDKNLKQGETFSQIVTPVGMEGTNNATLEISRFIPVNLEKHLKFLINYPHGCIEQVTSAVFPQLYLNNMVSLSEARKDEIQKNVREGINRLRSFQLSAGGFSYWPGRGDVSHWGTNYAGDFLLEAKEKGYDIPSDMLDTWIRYQKKAARNWREDPYYDTRRNTSLVQAYRLYTLALAGSPAKGAMNRMRKADELSMQAKWRLAAAYELTGKSQAAQKLVDNVSTSVAKYQNPGYTYGSHIRDRAMILETLMLMNRTETARKIMLDLGKRLGSHRWYSTQTTAYTLKTISKYLGAYNPDEQMEFEYTIAGKETEKVISEAPVAQIDLPVTNIDSLPVSVTNNSSNILYSRIIVDGIPLSGEDKNTANDLKMHVRYTDMNGETFDPSKITQGEEFRAEVTVTHPGVRDDYEELVLSHIFPSGWEIHNFRLDKASTARDKFDEPEYQDIRDDRVYTYFDLERGDTKTFVFQLNASYPGEYYLPAVRCEAMYDHSISAQKAGKWVQVVKAGKD